MHEGLREQVGARHTRLLAAINDELKIQHPGAFHEEGDGEIILPSGVTPRTAFVKIDTSAIAEVILSLVSKVSVPGGPTDAFHLSCPNCGQAIDLIPEQGSSRSQPEADKCSLTLRCSHEGAGGSGAALTREGLIDLASEALSDSIDMDWTPSVGARYVIDHLLAEGVIKA